MDFERCNLGAVERENELKLDRAGGKIPGEPIRDDRPMTLRTTSSLWPDVLLRPRGSAPRTRRHGWPVRPTDGV